MSGQAPQTARNPKPKAGLAVAIVVLLASASGLWWLTSSRTREAPAANALPGTAALLQQGWGKLGANTDIAPILTELRAGLLSARPDEAVAAIVAFLDSQQDMEVGVFKVGRGGELAGWSSFRVFLLDVLAEIDPNAAAGYARKVLAEPTRPDEWAIALRNVARADSTPEASTFLEDRFSVMLQQTDWSKNPSVGFLESFDVAVHVGSINLVPQLSALMADQENRATAHAAFLALDRMAIQQPAEILSALEQTPEVLAGRKGVGDD